MDLNKTVAVVTGANRGLGRHLAAGLVERGAKVYAAARNPETVDLPGVIPPEVGRDGRRIDITAAAQIASDVTLLVNNAGISTSAPLIGGDIDDIRREMDVNFYGPLAVTRAFAPVIENNDGGTILNVLSVLSWFHPAALGSYASSKAAAWAMTDAVREELAPRKISVSALHVAYMDTDMAAGVPAEQKIDPADVAAQALDGIESGLAEILADGHHPVRQGESVLVELRVSKGLQTSDAYPTVLRLANLLRIGARQAARSSGPFSSHNSYNSEVSLSETARSSAERTQLFCSGLKVLTYPAASIPSSCTGFGATPCATARISATAIAV